MLNTIYLSIDGYSKILKNYDYSDITPDKLIFIPILLLNSEYGLTQKNLDLILVNSIPNNIGYNINEPSTVLYKIHNYFFLYVTILHEQGFHYIRIIFNKLDPDINDNTPKDLFLNLTKNEHKLFLLSKEGDSGDKAEAIIFGEDCVTLKQLFYFSNINNYSKTISEIEKEICELIKVKDIVESDINNSFFKDILTEEEKKILYEGKYDKAKAMHLNIKSKKGRGIGFYIPFQYGRDKK